MTEHTRESDEQLLIDFVLEVSGDDDQYLRDAANRLHEFIKEKEREHSQEAGPGGAPQTIAGDE